MPQRCSNSSHFTHDSLWWCYFVGGMNLSTHNCLSFVVFHKPVVSLCMLNITFNNSSNIWLLLKNSDHSASCHTSNINICFHIKCSPSFRAMLLFLVCPSGANSSSDTNVKTLTVHTLGSECK